VCWENALRTAANGNRRGPVLVTFEVIEHAEEKGNRQKVKQNFHGWIMAESFLVKK
jgi:hypothetical protein